MSNLYYTNQYISTTLAEAGGIDASQTDDITLGSVSGVETTKPGICCISYSDPIDTSKAEWITYTSIDASNKLVGATRGAEGFSAKSHSFGAVVAFPISKSHINNLNDALSIGDDPEVAVTTTLDEDTMASDSATALATQQSIKAYSDNNGTSLSRQAIINGNFDVWQRGTSFTALASDGFAADRWGVTHSSDAVVDIARSTDVPTASESNTLSNYSIHADVTTADASIAASQYYTIRHKVEGYNSRVFGFGESGTRYITISFWVKATKTGTYCIGLRATGGTRSYATEYTVNTTDTWEKKEVTIQVDTTGTWDSTNGIGLMIDWVLAAGSEWQITADTWSASNDFATSNQVNALDSTSNNFRLTQVQLCAGSVALPFMPKSYEEELRACQRYCYVPDTSGSYSHIGVGIVRTSTLANVYVQFPVEMRAVPTLTITANEWQVFYANTKTDCTALALATDSISKTGTGISATVSAGLTAGQAAILTTDNTAGRLAIFDAEI